MENSVSNTAEKEWTCTVRIANGTVFLEENANLGEVLLSSILSSHNFPSPEEVESHQFTVSP